MLTITLSETLPILAAIDGADPDDPCEDLADLAFKVSMYHPDERVRQTLDAFCAFDIDFMPGPRGPRVYCPDLDIGTPEDAGIDEYTEIP